MSIHFQSSITVPQQAVVDRAYLPSAERNSLCVGFKLLSKTEYGANVFAYTNLEIPLDTLKLLSNIVSKLEEMAVDVDEDEIVYLDGSELADLGISVE